MSYIKVLNANGIEVEERKELRNGDVYYNEVLETAVKKTREDHNRDNQNDLQTYEIVPDES